jgi:hypothetical protein
MQFTIPFVKRRHNTSNHFGLQFSIKTKRKAVSHPVWIRPGQAIEDDLRITLARLGHEPELLERLCAKLRDGILRFRFSINPELPN